MKAEEGVPRQYDGRPQIESQLSAAQTRDIEKILQEFSNVLCSKPGRTTVTEHQIDTGQTSPVQLPPYRLPNAYKQIVCEELKEMGVIECSSSEWAAPIVLVKKKDGTLCMFVDYRSLNSQSRTDAYPVPWVDDLIDQMGDAAYISTLDLSCGCWQMPLPKEARPDSFYYTIWVVPVALRTAGGSCYFPANVILEDIGEFAAVYLNDVVIHSTSWDNHIRHLREILQWMGKAGLTVKPKKCQIAMSQCTYLGHVVGNGEVWPEESKIKAVEDFPIPKMK